MEILLIILGAVLATIGGVIGRFFDSRMRRKDERNKYIAKLEVDACVWIYPLFKWIMLHLNQKIPDFQSAKKIVDDNSERFWSNRLLLPPGVPDAWVYCRNAIYSGNKEEAIRQAQSAFPLLCKRFDIKEFP